MSFTTTEAAGIIGYPLKQTQTEFISTAGVPGTPETATTDNIILSGSTATTDQFTAPSSTKPSVTTTVVRASRVSSDEVAVVSFADTP